jgi:hypothetical protein
MPPTALGSLPIEILFYLALTIAALSIAAALWP